LAGKRRDVLAISWGVSEEGKGPGDGERRETAKTIENRSARRSYLSSEKSRRGQKRNQPHFFHKSDTRVLKSLTYLWYSQGGRNK